MNTKTISSLFTIGALLTGITWLAAAQSSGPRTPMPSQGMMGGSGGMMGGSGGGMMGGSGGSGMTPGQGGMSGQGTMGGSSGMAGMMQMAGMTAQMLAQGQMMMHASIDPNDPSALLGMKDQLGLTDEQSSQLDAIVTRARDDARAVLTDAQRSQLETLPQGSNTMAAMIGQMMAHMQQSGAGNSMGTNMQGMMQMMMNMPMLGGTQTTP